VPLIRSGEFVVFEGTAEDSLDSLLREICVCTAVSTFVEGLGWGGGEGVNRGGAALSSFVGIGLAIPSQTWGGPTRLNGAEHGFSVPS
jgi:hypothetical protein